ncbi:fimbrial protein [Escherichia coli]|uniref:fimbrial protein n=1 Tax=Escherichia coli TaxID=562 RepID=UPI0019CF11D1|nr:fimbrial protein [Escherichia coli]CAD5735967.1 putative fimbrial protein FanH [Escherichia coli]CAD5792636.1 putative fimbrial protein FanH [Escherichia coli]
MINKKHILFSFFSGTLGLFMTFNNQAAQKASISLPIEIQVTNPQCQINKGKGLPETIQLPQLTTSGYLSGNNSIEVPIVIDCISSITKFEVTLTGGRNSKINTSNNMLDIILAWKRGGGPVEFGTPVELNKSPFLVNQNQFDGTLLASVSPHIGTIPAGNYSASFSVTFTYY